MSDKVRTRSQLQALFPDNVSHLITPQDARDFIVTTFGFLASSAPSATNDNVDTAGVGAFFDTGSKWNNTTNGRLYYCESGAPGAAVWCEIPCFTDLTFGTVTSVNLSMPAGFSVSGGPITSSGTFTVTWSNQNANTVFAGPSSGSPGTPGFRPLVVGDIPGLPASQITSGTFSTAQIPALDASKITTGTFAVGRIPSLDVSQITTGVFATAFLPATVLYSLGSHNSGTTTPGAVTIFSLASANGLVGAGNIKNTGATKNLRYQLHATDWLGNVGTGALTTLNPGFFFNFVLDSGLTVGAASPPFVAFSMTVQDDGAGGATNYSFTVNAI